LSCDDESLQIPARFLLRDRAIVLQAIYLESIRPVRRKRRTRPLQ
jgi:hypothetical protein